MADIVVIKGKAALEKLSRKIKNLGDLTAWTACVHASYPNRNVSSCNLTAEVLGDIISSSKSLQVPPAFTAKTLGQRVAVIDTGVAPHSRLPKTAAGGDYVFTGDGTQDCDGHGTAVAGRSKPGRRALIQECTSRLSED